MYDRMGWIWWAGMRQNPVPIRLWPARSRLCKVVWDISVARKMTEAGAGPSLKTNVRSKHVTRQTGCSGGKRFRSSA
jgi:hypothetical protein